MVASVYLSLPWTWHGPAPHHCHPHAAPRTLLTPAVSPAPPRLRAQPQHSLSPRPRNPRAHQGFKSYASPQRSPAAVCRRSCARRRCRRCRWRSRPSAAATTSRAPSDGAPSRRSTGATRHTCPTCSRPSASAAPCTSIAGPCASPATRARPSSPQASPTPSSTPPRSAASIELLRGFSRAPACPEPVLSLSISSYSVLAVFSFCSRCILAFSLLSLCCVLVLSDLYIEPI